jgi:benzoyl-CoA reductase subunit C
MDRFKEAAENRHRYALEWKERTDGKVLGYFCTYMPEEVLHAAGVLPVRILGSHQPQDVSEKHIYTMFCPFCRDCLAQGLQGRFDYLNGVAMAHSCIHIRQAYGSWVQNVPTLDGFSYYLSMPSKPTSPRARPFLISELEDFQRAVEEWTGKAITPQALQEATEVYNLNRRLMRQIYELRRSDNPPVSGEECMYMVIASQCMDKAEHNRILQEVLAERSGKEGVGGGTRLMLIGSEDDDTEFVRMAESMDAIVVTDDHCTGSRYFWGEAPAAESPLASLADRYLQKVPCPEKDWDGRVRWEHIFRLIEEYRVEGALLIQQKFCDPHEFDIPMLMKVLQEERGIPCLFLEFDVTVPAGQFRTRMEAFLEMVSLGV